MMLFEHSNDIFTVPKRSLRRLCFHKCLSFCPMGWRLLHPRGSVCRGVCIGGSLHLAEVCIWGVCIGWVCIGRGASWGSASGRICILGVYIQGGLGRHRPLNRILRDTVKKRYASYWNAFLFVIQAIQHHKTLKKVASVITSWDELDTQGIWLGCDSNDVTRLRNNNASIRDAAYQILGSFYNSVPNRERWAILAEALEELNKHSVVNNLNLKGLHETAQE